MNEKFWIGSYLKIKYLVQILNKKQRIKKGRTGVRKNALQVSCVLPIFKSPFFQAVRFFYYKMPISTCFVFIGKQEIFIFVFIKRTLLQIIKSQL